MTRLGGKEMWDHFYRFAGHLVCYVPVLALVGMGWMQHIHRDALGFFLIDGLSTVSLVLCCDCWGQLNRHIADTGSRQRRASKSGNAHKAEALEEQLHQARRSRAKYSLCTALTLLGWLIVSQHTLMEMGKLHHAKDQQAGVVVQPSEVATGLEIPVAQGNSSAPHWFFTPIFVAVDAIKKSYEGDGCRTLVAAIIAGFSFVIALWKAWDMTSGAFERSHSSHSQPMVAEPVTSEGE